jgi:NADH dehydrogenase (ubiquinone) 1 alpha subcomplex subunit 13
MGVGYKQDMPPPGGYKKLYIDKTYVQRVMSGPRFIALSAAGFGLLYLNTKRVEYKQRGQTLVNHDTILAKEAFVLAERDRNWLKLLKSWRSQETELMKDVPGWKTGTYYGEPTYLTTEPNGQWRDPDFNDIKALGSSTDIDDFESYHWTINSRAGPKWYDKYLPTWVNDNFK